MNENTKEIKAKSFISVGSLIAQSAYSAILGFLAFFVLTIKSEVYLLGVYNSVLAIMNFFNYFSNLGLAAAIVQKKKIEEIDLNTAFFIQFLLTSLAVAIGFFLTRYLFTVYKDLPSSAVYLYWSLLISFFILSLKTIPSVLLEKKIEIYKVVAVSAVENTLFYLSIIIFSSLNFEIYSLVIAVLIRAIFGLIAIYTINPWLPKPMFSFQSAKSLLRFGIPFQGNSFLALVKDDLLIIYLGSVLGFKTLGYVTFAKKYAEFSIRLVMDNINRVAFPLLSKFQQEKSMLKKSLEKILFYESLFIFPIIIGSLFIFDSLLRIFPHYFSKWHYSLFSFYFFSLSALFISLTTPFVNLFNAVGKVKLSLYFMILWTALTWLTVPSFIKFMDYNGVSLAFFVMSLTFIFVWTVAKRIATFSIYQSINVAAISTVTMAVFLLAFRIIFLNFLNIIYFHIFFSLLGGGLIYFLTVFLIKGKKAYNELLDLLSFKTQKCIKNQSEC